MMDGFKTRIFMLALICCAPGISVHADVSFKDSGGTVILRNRGVALTIEKESAQIIELLHEGRPLLEPRQKSYFTIMGTLVDDSGTTYGEGKESNVGSMMAHTENCAFKMHVNTAEMVDVSCTPERGGFPFDLEIHYVLRTREAGFHCYAVAAMPKDSPDAMITQFRFAMRVDNSMLNIRLNDERSGVLPSAEALAQAQGMVMDATYLLQSGETITKYQWSSPTGEAPVYGLNNGTQGVWIISPENEYLCGGPTKQHNTCHGTDKGPILLKHFYSNHYGSRGSYVSGEWQKIFGPFFVYLNQKNGAEALWDDAKREYELQKKDWPFKWLNHPAYPLDRGVVTGRFKIKGPAELGKGWVLLARPTEYRDIDWQQQGGDTYIHRARINKDGSFAVPAVRQGSYTLYAFAPGMVGEYRKDHVSVNSIGEVKLGNLPWPSRSSGNVLWRIGVPDRTAAEYRNGDDFHQWGLWFNYQNDFPNDVDFIIGESKERTDWNYAHMAVWEESGGWKPILQPRDRGGKGDWRLPTWKVRFQCDEPVKGRATLTIALASVSSDGGLAVGLNGKPVQEITDLKDDGSLPRSGIQGVFNERFVSFDAALLRKGENILTLDLLPVKRFRGKRKNYPHFGIMYDFLQLELNGE